MDNINKHNITRYFQNALVSYDHHAFAQQQIHLKLISLLKAHQLHTFSHVLEIGCGTGGFTRQLSQNLCVENWVLNDLCASQNYVDFLKNYQFIQCDAESDQFLCTQSHCFDLVASASAIQWFHQQPQFLKKVSHLLKTGGYFLFNSFQQHNLQEVRQASGGVGLIYPNLESWFQWLHDDFEILTWQQENIVLTFENPQAVLKHLKQTGVTATQQGLWTKSRLQRFYEHYPKENNVCHLTYAPFYVLAQKRTESNI